MKQKIILLVLLSFIALPFSANALTCGTTTGGPSSVLNRIMQNITNAASVLGGGLAVIGFIIAGILYLLAGGSPEKIGKAKTALIAAAIGTALIALAQGANILQDIFCKLITSGT